MAVQFTRYTGLDQVEGHDRYAIEYGPLLMAVAGLAEGELYLRGAAGLNDLEAGLRAIPDRPLHYRFGTGSGAAGNDVEIMPYFQVTDEWFSCFPLVNTRRG
jgi:hypothetical protein